ncbi:hypothetical protein TspCOW1_26710 [Thiohalobacter sp. COW1]|uniref:DUF2189 domain-containing protein n=1 Tax=Thiohalobacter sp. COW1 TaxID=2795687 RepID=UPI0019160F3F|nr:DUF2189 domain-containing protein [Thiohalobacter sp. COW1]BCO32568.1 hypothetical protein TspCOW1_26710 [Thiohalobacter sp. COW1]
MAGLLNRLYPEDIREIQPKETLDSDTPPINRIDMRRPLHWLAQGWQDLRRAPVALIDGLVVALVGLVSVWLTWSQPWLSFSLVTGFLLIAPVLSVGVNELARRLDTGEALGHAAGLDALMRLGWPLWLFAGLLIVLFNVWASYIWLWLGVLNVGSAGVLGSVDQMLLAFLSSAAGIVSLAGLLVAGAVLALAVFSLSLVTLPVLLDRHCSLVDAIAISFKAFRDNPRPLLLWAALITGLFALSALTAFIALVVVFPWLGLAMWHGYRDLVAWDDR